MPKPETTPEPRKFKWLDAVACDSELSPAVFRVAYLVRCIYGDNESGRCEAAMDTIARRLGVNEKTIRRAVDQLEDHGYLSITRRGWNHTNVLYPTIPERTKKSAPSDDETDSGADNPVPTERTFGGTKMSESLASVLADLAGAGVKPVPSSSSTIKEGPCSTSEGSRTAPDSAAPTSFNVDDDYTIPGVGEGWIVAISSRQPLVMMIRSRDDDGISTDYRVEHMLNGKERVTEISLDEDLDDTIPEADDDAA